MLKYFCNGCQREIPGKERTAVQVKKEGIVRVYHFCKECGKIMGVKFEEGILDAHEKFIESKQPDILTDELPELPEVPVPPMKEQKMKATLEEEKCGARISLNKHPVVGARIRSDINVVRQCLARFYKGDSVKGISSSLNLSYQSVYQYISKYGCEDVLHRWERSKNYQLEDNEYFEQKESVIALVCAAWPIDEISEELGLEVGVIKEILSMYVGI